MVTVQLFVYILDASNVVNGVPLEYVTLHGINYKLKEAVSSKDVTDRVYVTENSTLNNLTGINCSTICIHIGCI